MVRNFTAAIAIVILMTAALPAAAQDISDKPTLTIPEAIELAWRNNIRSISQIDNVRLAQAQKLNTRQTFLPTLRLNSSWTRSSPTQLAFINNELVELKNFYRFGISLDQPLFNGFRYVFSPRSSQAGIDRSEAQLRSTRQQIALDTKKACYDLLKAQMLTDVQKQAVKRSAEQLETAKARYDLGSASLSDFLKSKVQLGNDSLLLITRENDIAVKRATLNDLLGMPVTRPTEIDARLEFEPHAIPNVVARQAAVDQHPDVLAAEHAQKAAQADIGVARAARYPTVSAFADYSYSTAFWPESFDEVTSDDNASIGISINYTIFSAFSTTSQIRQAKVREHTAEADVAQAKRTVNLAIATASLRVDEARKRYQVSEEQVTSAQEDLNIAQEKYNLGAATILDVLDAQVSLSQSQTDRIQAVFDYNLAVADLEKAMGKGD